MHKIISAIILLALSSVSVNAYSANGKETVCHKGKEISVADSAVPAHERHGDTVGECDEEEPEPEPEPDTMAAVVMMRCEGVVGNGVVVVSASSSVDLEIAVIQIFPPENDLNCARALAVLLNADAGLKVRSITSGSANSGVGEDDDLHLYTDYLLIGKVPADI
jgi:hypothetical protein